MNWFWKIISWILSKTGVAVLYLLALISFYVLAKNSIKLPQKILGINTILSTLLAFIAFIFSVRTFLVFKLKDLYDRPTEQKCFQEAVKQGLCSPETDYYAPLKKLDQYFNNVLSGMSFSTFGIIIIEIINAFISVEWLYPICELLGLTTIFLATLMILLSGHITNDIVKNLHLNESR